MYRAKSRGKNCYAFYDANLERGAKERLETETSLRRALQNCELKLFYQPQVDLQGNLKGFTTAGTIGATAAGALGALGAVCIIWAFRTGGSPTYVMPLVFGLAPVVNVIYTMAAHPPKTTPSPLLWIGFLFAALGAGMVLYFKPAS